jgi:hypothetical protein
VLEVNGVFERLFGFAQACASGKPLAELIIAPRLRAAYRAGRRQVLFAGPPPAARRLVCAGPGSTVSKSHADHEISRLADVGRSSFVR